MSCNPSKCKELVLTKYGHTELYSPVFGISSNAINLKYEVLRFSQIVSLLNTLRPNFVRLINACKYYD